MALHRKKATDSSPKIELGPLIKEVVSQLKGARDTDGDAIMQLDTCDIQLGVNVEKEGETGVKIYAFTLGGSVSQTKQSTITVRFKALQVNPFDPGAKGGGVFYVGRTNADRTIDFMPLGDEKTVTDA